MRKPKLVVPRGRRLPVLAGAAVAMAVLAANACTDKAAPPSVPLSALRTDRTYIRDEQNRYVRFHGINVSCATKIGPPGKNAQGQDTYVGRPFPLSAAREHYARLRAAGFNSMRLLVLWEAVEPRKKGEYDQEYLDYLRELVKQANEYGLYVLIDFHQDIFSRHLFVKFNSRPAVGEKGSVENTLMSLVQPFDERVQGDGAPRWAVEACLPEKNLDSKHWGTPRITSALTQDELLNIYAVYQKIVSGQLLGGAADAGVDGGPAPDAGASDAGIPPWVYQFALSLPEPFAPNESIDMLPFTNWALAHGLSLDVARAYSCFYAGNTVFPGLTADGGVPVQEYLQDAYANMAAKVAETVGDQPNVMGYDLMNEPSGNYIPLVALAGLMKAGAPGAESALTSLLGQETGKQVLQALVALRLLPPDTRPETLRLYGVDKLDLGAALSLNNGFDENHLRPFYERVGKAILAKDPEATMYVESALGVGSVLGGGPGGGLLPGLWEVPMKPLDLPRVVFAPHWYPDIYPFLGFNVEPRQFTAEQVRYREYDEQLKNASALASYSLGNVPVVFGEFGTYFNFNGIRDARAAGYDVSSHIIDNYYESFERLNQSNMQWCYSPENNYAVGDGWNREDFSILDPSQKPRGELAWARPFARALAGKPLSTHFYSDFHWFDPDKGVVPPAHEFEVRYGALETQAPTEISVPAVQYPNGFYVWLSDGQAYFDAERAVLSHRPDRDEPGFEHWVRLRPPLPGGLNDGWQYFFKDGQTVSRRARP